MGVLGVEAPATGLPEWTLLFWVIGAFLIALEAVREGWLASLALAQGDTSVIFLVWWSLGCANTGDRKWGCEASGRGSTGSGAV